MFNDLESTVESYLYKTPFIAKIYFGYELSTLRDCLDTSKKLRARYAPTEQWYIDYAVNLNRGLDAIYNTIDRTYATYEAVKNIPLIGKPISSMIEKYFTDTIIDIVPKDNYYQNNSFGQNRNISIPQKTTSLRVIENIGSLCTEGLCAHYEATTGESADNIRAQVQYVPTIYQTDPSPFRRCFIGVLESIGNFFGEMFGYNSSASPI